MGKKFVLTADRFEHAAGTVCYKCKWVDYGCSSDDERSTGIEHWAMTLNADGSYPFFTAPVNILREVPDHG